MSTATPDTLITSVDDIPDFLTPKEAGTILRLKGKNTIYDRMKDGSVPFVQMGRLKLIPGAFVRQKARA